MNDSDILPRAEKGFSYVGRLSRKGRGNEQGLRTNKDILGSSCAPWGFMHCTLRTKSVFHKAMGPSDPSSLLVTMAWEFKKGMYPSKHLQGHTQMVYMLSCEQTGCRPA